MIRIPTENTSPPKRQRPASQAVGDGSGLQRFGGRLHGTDSQPPPLDPLILPFVVAIDNRERAAGYRFRGIVGGETDRRKPLVVRTSVCHLTTGDYSVVGYEDLVCVERKEVGDLFRSATAGRTRLEAEHERMRAMVDRGGLACVVIEANWDYTRANPPTLALPESIIGTQVSWYRKYGIAWNWMSNHREAELFTFLTLRNFVEHYREKV